MVKPSNHKKQSNVSPSAWVGLCFCLCMSYGATAAQTVESLRYGTTLFYLFQQDYYSALTELMTAQQLDQLGSHKEHGELLRGGMSLSYGMDREAQKTFEVLLSEDGELKDSTDRDRAWFYLAKVAWKRDELSRSKVALEKMSAGYSGAFTAESSYLHSSIALREGDEQMALHYSGQLPLDSIWQYYLYYNLGAMQAGKGNWEAAVGYFGLLEQLSLDTDESKAIHDKALTASGFSYMALDSFDDAREQFTRVRLDSPMADRALLGYGWAASEMGNFGLALSSWQTLRGREDGGASTRESLLAIPYAYEELDRPGVALENYKLAADIYLEQLAAVRLAINGFRQGELAQLLDLGIGGPEPGTDARGWIFGDDLLPDNPTASHLSHLLTRHSFQLALRELQDLYRIDWHLSDASQRLQVLVQVDTDQQASWSTVTEGDRRERLQRRQQGLQERIDQLVKRLHEAEDELDGRKLADVGQLAVWQRIDRSVELADRLSTGSAMEQTKERLALYRGLMLWEDSEQFVARSWLLKRQIEELKTLSTQSSVLLESVDEAIARRGTFEFSQRISTMQARLDEHRARVDVTIAQSESQLRSVAVSELEQQEKQLARSLGQSRLAIARLYDEHSPGVSQ